MKKLYAFLSLITIISTSFADIYKWVDSNGNTHFSDTPHQGAEKLNIPDAQSYSPPAAQHIDDKSLTGKSGEQKEHHYSNVAVVQPDNGATIRNNQGYVEVTAQVEPKLMEGDQIQLIFDGSPLGEPQPILHFQLSNIYRGSHTIAVQVIDVEGNALASSDPITIYMFRPRVGMVKH